jgi:hypothetical protein
MLREKWFRAGTSLGSALSVESTVELHVLLETRSGSDPGKARLTRWSRYLAIGSWLSRLRECSQVLPRVAATE